MSRLPHILFGLAIVVTVSLAFFATSRVAWNEKECLARGYTRSSTWPFSGRYYCIKTTGCTDEVLEIKRGN